MTMDFDAVIAMDHRALAKTLLERPEFDINQTASGCRTFIGSYAMFHLEEELLVLLEHPKVDVNLEERVLPITAASRRYYGYQSFEKPCLRILAFHPDTVFINARDQSLFLRWLETGMLESMLYAIASGKTLWHYSDHVSLSKQVARQKGYRSEVSLLTSFQENKTKVRHIVRQQMGWYVWQASGLFALSIFVLEGFLAIPPDRYEFRRFIDMARRLPIEILMTICHRAFGSRDDLIPVKDREAALNRLGISCLMKRVTVSS